MASSAATPKSKPPKPTFKGGQTVVTITVSSSLLKPGFHQSTQGQVFIVHKEFLTYNSLYFATAFNGKFKEGITQSIILQDVDPTLFAMLVHWIYTNSLGTASPCPMDDLSSLCRLWILGQRFIMAEFQDMLMAQMVGLCRTQSLRGLLDMVKIANEYQGGENLLAKLAVDTLLRMPKADFADWVDKIPIKMVVEIAKTLKWYVSVDKMPGLEAREYLVCKEEK